MKRQYNLRAEKKKLEGNGADKIKTRGMGARRRAPEDGLGRGSKRKKGEEAELESGREGRSEDSQVRGAQGLPLVQLQEGENQTEEEKKKKKQMILKKILPMASEMLAQPSAAQMLFNYFMVSERIEMELEEQIRIGILDTIAKRRELSFEPRRLELTDAPPETFTSVTPTSVTSTSVTSTSVTSAPLSLDDISYLEDSEFWLYFHVSRKMMRLLVAKVKDIALSREEPIDPKISSVPLRLVVMICLWYLRGGEERSPKEGARLFQLESSDLFESVLRRGLKLLTYLSDDSGIRVPTSPEFSEVEKGFRAAYGISNCAGVIAYRVLTDENKKRLLYMVVIDEKKSIRLVAVSNDTRPYIGLHLGLGASLASALSLAGFKIIGYKSGFDKASDLIRFDTEGEVEARLVRTAEETLDLVVLRFPRLGRLHDTLHDAPLAASVLHNYSRDYQDLAPLR